MVSDCVPRGAVLAAATGASCILAAMRFDAESVYARAAGVPVRTVHSDLSHGWMLADHCHATRQSLKSLPDTATVHSRAEAAADRAPVPEISLR